MSALTRLMTRLAALGDRGDTIAELVLHTVKAAARDARNEELRRLEVEIMALPIAQVTIGLEHPSTEEVVRRSDVLRIIRKDQE